MEKLTTMKIAYEDGTYSKQIPIGALAQNIEWDEEHSLLDVIGTINIDRKGSIQDQLNAKVNTSDLNRYLRDAINQQVSDWLDENISKVGQGSIIIDGGLAQPGQAAEAKATEVKPPEVSAAEAPKSEVPNGGQQKKLKLTPDGDGEFSDR